MHTNRFVEFSHIKAVGQRQAYIYAVLLIVVEGSHVNANSMTLLAVRIYSQMNPQYEKSVKMTLVQNFWYTPRIAFIGSF